MTEGKVVTYCCDWSDSVCCRALIGWCNGYKVGICKEMNRRIQVNELAIWRGSGNTVAQVIA
jgi:hypothetical protein